MKTCFIKKKKLQKWHQSILFGEPKYLESYSSIIMWDYKNKFSSLNFFCKLSAVLVLTPNAITFLTHLLFQIEQKRILLQVVQCYHYNATLCQGREETKKEAAYMTISLTIASSEKEASFVRGHQKGSSSIAAASASVLTLSSKKWASLDPHCRKMERIVNLVYDEKSRTRAKMRTFLPNCFLKIPFGFILSVYENTKK